MSIMEIFVEVIVNKENTITHRSRAMHTWKPEDRRQANGKTDTS